MSKTPTAYWPVPSLLRSLSHAGWGEHLRGRQWQGVRSTLYALAAHCDDKTGRGVTTAEQIAENAGLSTRWVRRCLNVLEDLGVIVWQRGGISAGRCVPSAFRILKKRLVDLIAEARASHAERVAARREANRRRAEIVRNGFHGRKKPRPERFTCSDHAELSDTLSSPRGEPSRGSRPANSKERRIPMNETPKRGKHHAPSPEQIERETREAIEKEAARARLAQFHATSGKSWHDLGTKEGRTGYLAAFRKRLLGGKEDGK